VETGTAAERRPLRFAEDMTVYNAAAQKEQLLEELRNNADPGRVDLKQVAEIDTAGVQLLLLAKRCATERGHELRLVRHSAAVVDVLQLLDLAAHFGDPLVVAA